MNEAFKHITDVLSWAKYPVLLWSGGKESMLLLHMIRTIKDIPVIWFRSGTDEHIQKQLIRDEDITVFSYPPAIRYLLWNEGRGAIVDEYSFGSDRLPLITDITPGDACSLQPLPHYLPAMYSPWDAIFVGWKDSDSHWAMGEGQFAADGFHLGEAQIFAPLRHFTDSEIFTAIENLNLTYDKTDSITNNTDSIPLCTACYTSPTDTTYCPLRKAEIPVEHPDWVASLSNFRRRFNLEATHG